MDDSSLMRDRVRPPGTQGKGNLLSLLENPAIDSPRAEPEPEARGEGDWLPKPGDAYRAHSRATNQVEPTLHVLDKDGYSRGFSWGSYDSLDLVAPDRAGAAPSLHLRFDGLRPAELVIEGRNLSVLHVYLGQHRIAWIRELPKGHEFRVDAATVINRISIRPLGEL